MMWMMILFAVAISAIVGTGYLVAAVGRFGFIRTLCGKSRVKKILIPLGLIGIVFAICYYTMNMANAIVILLYTIAFFLLSGILMKIIQWIRRKKMDPQNEEAGGEKSGIYWQGWLAILSTVLFFTIGYYQCNNIWQTDYKLSTDKSIGTLRAAMLSDSHIGATFDGNEFARELRVIEAQHPDILLIPGDFVDDWSKKEDLITTCRALGELDIKYGVWIAYGNHDEGFFNDRDFSAQEMEEIFKENGIHLLIDEVQLIDDRFYVAGRRDRSLGPRMDMNELLAGVDTARYIIVLDHQPNDYEAEAASDADLVLSGHTHGGQLIPINITGKLFGLHDRVYGYERRNGTDFIVTSGISNWALQFKTGTRSEYVIIDIEGRG